MELPDWIEQIPALAPPGARPLDRLQRSRPLEAGRKAVAALSARDAGVPQGTGAFLLVQGALYLYFDCFEEAHSIAQDHDGLEGNWLHAILHRREPDAGNSRYWYRRVRPPEALSREIGRRALALLEERKVPELAELKRRLETSKEWEPGAFVDLCEEWRGRDAASRPYGTLAGIQEIEWRELLGYLAENFER